MILMKNYLKNSKNSNRFIQIPVILFKAATREQDWRRTCDFNTNFAKSLTLCRTHYSSPSDWLESELLVPGQDE